MITFTVGKKGLFGHPAFLFQNVFTQPKSDKSEEEDVYVTDSGHDICKSLCCSCKLVFLRNDILAVALTDR